MRRISTAAWLSGVLVLCSILAVGAAVGYRTWPRDIPFSARTYPSPQVDHNRFVAPFPAQTLLADVGSFDDELSAYLWFDYFRSRPEVSSSQVFLNVTEDSGRPVYHIYLEVPNDALVATPYLAQLERKGYLDHFDWIFCTPSRLTYAAQQTSIFVAAYRKPTKQTLETITADKLEPSVARFLIFKSRTDPRVRVGAGERPSSLNNDQATEMAADIMAVAKFYDLPLDVFLGIGAMENNYLDVRGDLKNTVWKRKAAKDDIILKRRRHRVLVSNYSIGPWQITRETLRHAHELYRKDKRDYSQLPERLRPPTTLELDLTNSHVLTTYAGLLLRDLLDRFGGDVKSAVGAYNGGPHRPNPEYAAGVNLVAEYARNVLERVNAANDLAVAQAQAGQRPASVPSSDRAAEPE